LLSLFIHAGAGESGKSTILKQMKLIYASGFSIADRDNYRCIIYSNIINSMRTLLTAMEAHGLTFDIEENKVVFSSVPSSFPSLPA
jgi:guanine nucleotide-binding protein subunit alpha